MASLTTASTSTGETKDNVLNCKWGKIQLQLNFKPGITTVGDLRTIISKSTSIQASGIKLLNLKIKKRKLDDTCLVSDCKLPKILKIMGTAQSNMLSAAPSSNPTQQPRETYVYGALFCSQAKRERDESAEKSSQNSSKKPKYDTTSLSSGLRESIAKVLSKVSPEVSLATDAMNFMDEILHKFFDALQASNNGNNEMITLSVLQNSLRIGLGDELSTFFLSQAAKDDKKSSEPSESSTSSSQVLGLTGPLFSLSLAGSIFSQPITKDALSLLAASVEFLASEILELSGNTASECERKTVLPCDIQSALRNDEELNVLCTNLNVSMTDYYPVFQLISGVDGQVTQLSLEHLIRTRDNHGSAFGVLSGMDCSSSDLNVIIPNVTTTAIKVVYKWHCGTNCTSCIVECLKTAADPTLYTEVFMAADFLGCGELCDVLLQSFELATDPIDTIRSCFQMIPNFPQILFFRLGLPDEATAGEFLRTLTTNPQELTYSELQLCDGMYLKEGALSYLSEPLQNVPMVGLSPEIEKSLSVSAFNGYRHLQTKEKQKSKTWNISTTLELKEWTKKERLRRQEMFDAGKNGAVERTTDKLVDQQFWLAVAEDDLPAAKNLYKQGACANLWFEFEETGNEGIAVPFDTYKMISNWEGTPFDDWKNHLYRTDSSILPHLMKYGLTTLMKASQNNSIAMMSWLIDVGCDVNESQPNFKDANGFFPFGGATALVCASTPDAVKLLLARGADPNAWYTPPQESAGLDARPVLATHLELRRGSDRNLIARALVHHGANVNEVSYPCFDRGSDDGWRHKLNNSPVSYWPSVVASGDTVWAKELIDKYEAALNWPNLEEFSSPRWLFEKNLPCRHVSSLRFRGLGATVLQIAIMSENVEMVKIILEHESDFEFMANEFSLKHGGKSFSSYSNEQKKVLLNGEKSYEEVKFSSSVISFLQQIGVWSSDSDVDETVYGISPAQRKHYWGKDSWEEYKNKHEYECHNTRKKASPLSVAVAIGNKEIIALLNTAGATSHPENATTPISYDWNLKTN